jgi:hypothetical protein
MRRYRDRSGRPCLWYGDDEIEHICASALGAAKLFPDPERTAVDIERFVESHLRVRFDHYAELEPDVLGVTEFVEGEDPWIRINRDLTGSALDDDQCPLGVLGRWRATVAHEAAHVLLHRVLFPDARGQLSLFGPDEPTESEATPRLFRSLKRDVSFGYRGGDWREIQANKGMAALLMPRAVFLRVCDREVERQPLSHLPARPDHAEVLDLVFRLSEAFQVSRQAAAIRVEQLDVLRRYNDPGLLG